MANAHDGIQGTDVFISNSTKSIRNPLILLVVYLQLLLAKLVMLSGASLARTSASASSKACRIQQQIDGPHHRNLVQHRREPGSVGRRQTTVRREQLRANAADLYPRRPGLRTAAFRTPATSSPATRTSCFWVSSKALRNRRSLQLRGMAGQASLAPGA